MKISDLDQPRIGDIVEFETDPETVVEGLIVGETEDGYIYEFSESGYTELDESCTYGKYYCSTDKKYKCRTGPKQSRDVSEAEEDAFISKLGGLKSYQVVIMNNYYRGKYSDYSGRYYYVLASSPEEAKQVVLDNADAILQELLAIKSHNGKKILPRGSAVRITPDRIGKVEDGTVAGRMTTAGFKKMYSPQGPMMVKLSSGAISDVQEQGVAEAHPNSKIYDKCWDGYKKVPGKKRGEKGSCVEESAGYIAKNSAEAKDPRFSTSMTVDVGTDTMRKQLEAFFPTEAPQDGQEQVTEAQYQGREVPLGRPMRGDVKKFKVYVKDPKTGNVKKVNFGDPNMRIKKSNPARRKSFRARHNCKSPGPRTKARYWSCRKW